MKNILLALFLFFFVASCSSDDPIDETGGGNPEGPKEPKNVTVGIRVSSQKGNIFDDLQFTLFPSKDCTMLDVMRTYDSLVWYVPELDERVKILENEEGKSKVKLSWANSFHNEGTYRTILRGFKDNQKGLDDTIVVSIENKRDILGYNWKDITETQPIQYGSTNVFDTRHDIYTRKIYENGSPALEIRYNLQWSGTIADEILKEYQVKEQEAKTLNYITSLYGKPKLSYEKEGTTIVDTYKNIFKHGDKKLVPRYIWETNTSRIVLLQVYGIWGEWNSYFAIAEPR